MDAILDNVTTSATVIGYPALLVVVLLLVWFGTRVFRDILKIFREMRYDRWKRMRIEKDWDNIEASWLLEYDEDEEYQSEEDLYHRHHTLELPDIQDQLYNYQEERYERP
jgi:hypothetical protein